MNTRLREKRRQSYPGHVYVKDDKEIKKNTTETEEHAQEVAPIPSVVVDPQRSFDDTIIARFQSRT